MLVSQRDDHKRNFSRTSDLADALSTVIPVNGNLSNHGPSLLRFYAAESGLKYLLNRYERVPFSYEILDNGVPADATPKYPKVESYSHDLGQMLRKLKVSAASVQHPAGPFRTINGYKGGQDFKINGAHEAWRYGLETDPAHQADLERFLTSIIAYVKGEI